MRFRKRVARRYLADPKRLGQWGEWQAYRYLRSGGYDVLAKNWAAPFGEVDLIARRNGHLYFIEVKTRQHSDLFRPEDAVTADKSARYRQLAAYFIKQYQQQGVPLRFLIISIDIDAERRPHLRELPMFSSFA
ncbi:MAG: YraN family protein [Acidobacteria bacterium]|nr:YraN family protein [Acidobacteriota bacterium]